MGPGNLKNELSFPNNISQQNEKILWYISFQYAHKDESLQSFGEFGNLFSQSQIFHMEKQLHSIFNL